jgi:hypothetical protein
MATPYSTDGFDDGRDIASQFNQQYDEAGLQPSVGSRASQAYDKVRQFGVSSTRVTGVAMRRGGKNMSRSGTKLMRTGAALSRSGAGAVVGVPLMAAGAALGGAGAANQSAGKRVTSSAQGTKKLLRAKGIGDTKTTIKKHVRATRVNFTVLSIAAPIWFTVQLPIALGAIFALGVAALGEEAAVAILNGPVTSILYSGYDAITNGLESVTGINFNLLETWSSVGQVLFGALTMLVFLIGAFTLFTMAVMYTFSGVNCFMGEHAAFKMVTFIIAMLGYLMPILNILPWFILWGIVVWRYPK